MSSLGPKELEKGFSIIEMLVVLAIIGILAVVILAIVSNARRVARDRKRISDTQLISGAVKAYVKERTSYPGGGGGGGCPASWACSFNGTFLSGLTPEYFEQVPHDPQHPSRQYYYLYRSFPGSGSILGCPRPYYVVVALLETASIADARNDASCWNGTYSNNPSAYVILGK